VYWRGFSLIFFLLFSLFPLCPPPALLSQQNPLPAAEAARLTAVVQALAEQGVPFEERPLFALFGGFGSSVHVRLPRAENPGQQGGEKTLVLAIPLSGAPQKEAALPRRLPFGVEAGLAFIRQAQAAPPPLRVTVAFLGNEASLLPKDSRSPNYRLGLEDLYASLEDPENTVLLYLDITAPPRTLIIHHGAENIISSRSTLEALYRIWGGRSLPRALAVRYNELYKLGLVTGPEVITSADARFIDALYLTGEAAQEGAAAVGPEALSASFMEYAGALEDSSGSLDRHFLIISFFGRLFFVPETVTVMVFLGIAGLFFLAILGYFTVYRKRLILLWQMFLGYAWVFPLFLIFLTASLETAGFITAGAGRRLGRGALPMDMGLAFLKIIIALPLFSALFSFGNALNIPKKADFYGSSAALLVIAGVLIAAFLDITFTPVFLWVLLCTLLGAASRNPVRVYVLAACAPVPALGPFGNILQGQGPPFSSGRLTEVLLSQDIIKSLYMAVIILPFMLLLERGAALRAGKKGDTAAPLSRRLAAVMGCFAASLGVLGLYTLYRSGTAPPEPVRRTIADGRGIMAVTLQERVFLERRSLTVRIEAAGDPRRFNLRLTGADQRAPVIYAAPMPYRTAEDWKSIEFQVGEGPPNPFVTEIILPLDFTGFLEAEALYTVFDQRIDALPPPETGDYILRVRQNARIKPAPLPHPLRGF
jgi:hypothetical protein